MIKIRFFIVLLLLGSCTSKFARLMHDGEVVQESFNETVPFDFSKGLPLIQVEIQGSEYTFLLDTGAPNVISKELAAKIAYKTIVRTPVKDSQGVRKKQESIRIKNIKIGGLDFNDMGAVVIDFNAIFEMTCFEISGIIGANLMAKAIWELDYEKGLIGISDKITAFDLSDDPFVVPFEVRKSQQTPEVKIKTDQLTFNRVTFDTGATGAFGLVKGKSQTLVDSLEGVEIVGSTSTGVYGDGKKSTNKFVKIDTLSMGNISLYEQVVGYESGGSITLGNQFLKGYRVVIDWSTKNIYLTEVDGYDRREYKGFGIIPKISDNKILVKALIRGSAAEQAGVELGNQILEINDMDYGYVSDSLGCVFVTGERFTGVDTLQIKVLVDSVVLEVTLPRTTFITSENN